MKNKSKIIRLKLPFIDGYLLEMLFTNYLKLGISIKKTPCEWFHFNFFTCQFVFKRIGIYFVRDRYGRWLWKEQFKECPLFIYFY